MSDGKERMVVVIGNKDAGLRLLIAESLKNTIAVAEMRGEILSGMEEMVIHNCRDNIPDLIDYTIPKEPTHESWKGKGNRKMRVK